MNICIKRLAARNIAVINITVSTFIALTVDGWSYMNSGWLCAVIGLIIALPVAFAADKSLSFRAGRTGAIKNACIIVIAVYMIYRAAYFSRLLINSVSYSNLQTLPPVLVSVVIYLVCFYGIMKNGRGLGNAMKLWQLAFVVLLIVIFLASLGDMRPSWLMPVFGPGFYKILDGAITAAGHIATGMLLVTCPEDRKRYDCTKTALIGGVASCLLCVYWSLMTPLQLTGHYNRLTGIETLLSNGRSSLLVLLPTTAAWFMGIMAALAGAGFSGAMFLQSISGRLKRVYIAAATVLAAFLIANFGLAESDSARLLSQYAFAAVILLMIAERFSGRKNVANEK